MSLSTEYPNVQIIGEPNGLRNCYIESRVHGLFACLYCIIYGFYICEKENLNGIVRMGEEHLYYEKSYGENVFDYFFTQEKDAHASITIRVTNPFPFLRWGHISAFDKIRANSIIKRELHLRPEIQKIIVNFKKKNFCGGNMLGVHYRGRDKRNEVAILPFKYYVEKIDEILNKKICERIFFSTDELSLREVIASKYKDKVIMYELEADTTDSRLTPHEGLHINSKTPYLQGKDALIEMYLLSSCTLLLSSYSSSMSIFSTYINPNLIHIPLEI